MSASSSPSPTDTRTASVRQARARLTPGVVGLALRAVDLVLIALTAQGQALKEKARNVPQSILEASDCSVAELVALKSEIVSLRDRLNAALGE